MIPANSKSIVQLPIAPTTVLFENGVFEEFDNRFRSAARLLQSLWRQRQGLPSAVIPKGGRKRRVGSILAKSAADEGRNFLTHEIAEIARLEVAYQEPGAMIDQERLFANLLSSMPLCVNLFGPLWNDRRLAARILRKMIPGIDLKAVVEVRMEHSPGRQDPTLTGDRSAFDIAFIYERGDGELGLVGLEAKYSESCDEPMPPAINPRYAELAPASGLFADPADPALRTNPVQQLFREHLLAQAAVDRGDYAEAWFVLVAPRLNRLVRSAGAFYASHLVTPQGRQVPFVSVTLEQVIDAYRSAGARAHAAALHDRYADWDAVDRAVREGVQKMTGNWVQVSP